MIGQESLKLGICRVFTIAIFVSIVLAVLAVLAIGVHNDKPSIATEVIQFSEFPLPIQLYHVLYTSYYHYTSELCSSHITQPTFNYGQWTGKFSPNNRTFPSNQTSFELKRILFRFDIIDDVIIDGDIPAYTINIFDSANKTLVDIMYEEAAKDKYFEKVSSFATSVFRSNRYFLGRSYTYHIRMTRHVTNMIVKSIRNDFGWPPSYNTSTYITTIIYPTTRNSSYFGGATGFMIDPSSFVVETLTEQRNKNALSVISNVLAVGSALLTCYWFLFGIRPIDPWGAVRRKLFTRENLELGDDENEDEISSLKHKLTKLEILVTQHVVNVEWLERKNNSSSIWEYNLFHFWQWQINNSEGNNGGNGESGYKKDESILKNI